MDNITEYMIRQLQSVGFSYPDYEHHLNFGMVYAWNSGTYRIGGCEDGTFSKTDRQAAAEGLWLPDSDQLLSWLKGCGFTVSMQLDADGYCHVTATDSGSGNQYSGSGPVLSHALHKAIYKICKSGGPYRPEPILRLEILSAGDITTDI